MSKLGVETQLPLGYCQDMNTAYILNTETDQVVLTGLSTFCTREGALEVLAKEAGFASVSACSRAYGGLTHLVVVRDGIEVEDA